MPKRIFGTDGIRGRVNSGAMTAETALKLGLVTGAHLRRNGGTGTVLIGKDTRRSGYMLESAMVAGFCSIGMNVLQTGPLPTPAVAMLTRTMRADLGVMISASHNPHEDNGIKFFGPDGHKLSDADELAIEDALGRDADLAEPSAVGRARRIDGATDRYVEFAKRAFPRGLSLSGLKIVVDAANGAAFRTAPALIWELGADVIEIGTKPDGFNINARCGSTAPEACAAAVRAHGADLGIALDGDADRVHLIDETGQIVDGDQVMALIAERAMARGELARATLVATIMSNAGLVRHLDGHGIAVERTKVGDRHVMERMRALGCNVGGEQSGHIILSDHATTGDGLVAALQALAAIVEAGRPASEVLTRFAPLPQLARSVPVADARRLLEAPALRRTIADAEAELAVAGGRVVIRASGTEPVLRLMAEGEDRGRLDALLGGIEAAVHAAGARPETFLSGVRATPAPQPLSI